MRRRPSSARSPGLLALSLGLGLSLGLAAAPAQAFSTRVHIVLANKVREALVDAGDGTIALRFGDHAVILDPADAAALADNPLAFRAGAVGPDNMVFPGMTDPSHALGQRPFEQCELLYQEALTGEERAYALGCFLHGSTDAIAHHYVNFMTGETFTLTPITSARQDSYDNVVRHILAETAIQDAAYEQDPAAFADSKLLHTIPIGFVLRAYLDVDSPLWQMMAAHAKAEYDAVVAEMPGASLPAIVAAMDVAPADHLVLSPIYLGAVDQLIADKRAELEAAVAAMQDPNTPEGAELLVQPGDDGKLGTKDDDTDCAFTCPNLYATYFTYAGLLAPRYNAQNQELPSAFDKISEELRAELFSFHVAYLETVELLSAKLNREPSEMDGGFGVTQDELKEVFAPLDTWSSDLTTIDYDTLVYAVVPDWIIDLDTLMQSVGVDVDLAAIIEAVFAPIVQPIKDAIYGAFIAQAQQYLDGLVAEIEAKKDAIYGEYDARLAAAAHPDLSGDALDHLYDSGLYGHSFNIAAAAIASHEAVLPSADEGVDGGPNSFDASYTPAWMQAGACDYLQGAIFPLGIDVAGALSVREGGVDYPAQLVDDAPIECHDGSLMAFADAPTQASCAVVRLAELLNVPVGSVSRAFPPALGDEGSGCADAVVPGLPEPPPGGDTDSGSGTDSDSDSDSGATESGGTGGGESDSGGATESGGSGGATVGGATATATTTAGVDDPDGSGCGCRADRGAGEGAVGFGLGLLGLLGLRRRRRGDRSAARAAGARGRGPRVGLLLPALLGLGLTGCAGDDMEASASEASATSGASTSGTTGASGDASTSGASEASGDATTTSDGATTTTSGDSDSDSDATSESDSETDGDTTTDTGGSMAGELLSALDGTVWRGAQTRGGLERAYELRFDSDSLLWSELRNPYGPARLREMRAFKVDADGLTAHSTVIQPPGWEVHPENGRKDDWTIEVLDGDPRTLRTTRDGVVEEFTEGEWPAPEGGLTAIARVFKVGGAVDEAFCDSGAGGFDYPTLFAFARGDSDEIVASDVVAGAPLLSWTDPSQNNQFSLNDVAGFDQLGGTELSDSFNFFVTYSGTISHPGGALRMREADDSVEDGVWVFLGDKVGSADTGDLFLEVHGFAWPDKTADEPSADVPAGEVAIEALLVRCTEAIKDVDVEIRLPGDAWKLVGEVASTPVITDELFPPAI
ncbi:MAG: MYXO-CTERM sorting domain-containing protein [Nannocystaceae bacterium]